MIPEQEWEYEQELDHLFCRLQELIFEMFINVVQKLKDRNKPIAESQAKFSEDEIPF